MYFRKINNILLAFLVVFLIASFSLNASADNAGGKHVRMMAQILIKAGVPLDEAQIEQIKSIERGPDARKQIHAVLTAEQAEALKNVPHRGRGKHGSPVRMMAQILIKAGVPLDEAQIEQIKSIERGPDARKQIHDVLTAEQAETLKNAPHRRKHHRRLGLANILEEAGYPLTDEQLAQMKSLRQDASKGGNVIEAVLTAEQKAVLENRFKGEETVSGDAGNEETVELQKPAAVEEKPEAINLLKQNYPNPFNPATTIEFYLAKPGNVTLEIYGPNGQRLTTLVSGYRNAGQHTATWDASNYSGGVYVCKITAGDFTESRKMTFVK